MKAAAIRYGSAIMKMNAAIQNDRQLWQLNGLKFGRGKVCIALAAPTAIKLIIVIKKIIFELLYCFKNYS